MTVEQFAPERAVTRAEFATMMQRLLQLEDAKATIPFEDVHADDWYTPAIQTMFEAGVIQGRTATAFAPNEAISREEMAVIAMRVLALQDRSSESASFEGVQFADHNIISDWAQAAVYEARNHGLLQGRSATEFAPKSMLTRAEAAQVMLNVLQN